MQSPVESRRSTSPLPEIVRVALDDLARFCTPLGAELLLFGSVASTYPDAPRGADIDLFVRFESSLDSEDRKQRFQEIRRESEGLPTVRRIDLIDFDQVDAQFREIALKQARVLPLGEYG